MSTSSTLRRIVSITGLPASRSVFLFMDRVCVCSGSQVPYVAHPGPYYTVIVASSGLYVYLYDMDLTIIFPFSVGC